MRLIIRKKNLQWSDALATHAEHTIRRRLDRVRDRIKSVMVRLVDVNGPRGGADKNCKLAVRLSTGDEVLVTASNSCPYRAVNEAVHRLRRSVTNRIQRSRDRRRRAR